MCLKIHTVPKSGLSISISKSSISNFRHLRKHFIYLGVLQKILGSPCLPLKTIHTPLSSEARIGTLNVEEKKQRMWTDCTGLGEVMSTPCTTWY